MESQDNISDTPQAEPQQEAFEVKTPSEPRRWCWLAICSLVVTVIAWIIANLNGYVALCACAVAIVLGALALKSHRHAVRNTAITSIIAAAVLLVVLAAFMIVIYLGLKSL